MDTDDRIDFFDNFFEKRAPYSISADFPSLADSQVGRVGVQTHAQWYVDMKTGSYQYGYVLNTGTVAHHLAIKRFTVPFSKMLTLDRRLLYNFDNDDDDEEIRHPINRIYFLAYSWGGIQTSMLGEHDKEWQPLMNLYIDKWGTPVV